MFVPAWPRGRARLPAPARRVLAVALAAATLAAPLPALPAPAAGPLPELTSLHGFVLIPRSGGPEVPPESPAADAVRREIWSAGDNFRSETMTRRGRLTTIQRGEKIYSFLEGTGFGTRATIRCGLARHGLVRQIEIVKRRGTETGRIEAGGESLAVFTHRENFPYETTDAVLSVETSLPVRWTGVTRTHDRAAHTMTIHYRDMQANVEIPAERFEVPRNIAFIPVRVEQICPPDSR